MATSDNWGQGSKNNDNGWGKGASNNSNGWGSIHANTYGHPTTNLTGEGGFQGLLDLYPNAAFATGMRLLRADYSGGLLRIIAYSGASQQGAADIMPYKIGDNYWVDLNSKLENLDATATGRGLTTNDTLADLCSVGVNNYDGLVPSWYDQSLNANHATQTSLAAMPKLVDAGVLNTDINGKPEVKPDGVNHYLKINDSGFLIPNNSMVFTVGSYQDEPDGVIFSTVESSNYANCLSIGSNFLGSNSGVVSCRLGGITGGRGAFSQSKSGYLATDKVMTNSLIKSNFADSDTLFNGLVPDGSVSHRANINTPGAFIFRAVNYYGASPLNEIILYNDINQTANRSAIELNINNAYNIY